jgi:hypothetical protein
MGTSADITMTNLKSATGIADDRLSAHHPNGAGNQTKFGDFLVSNFGGNLDPGSDNTIDGLYLIPVEVNGSSANADGSYNANDYWEFTNINELDKGDTIKIEVWFKRGQNTFSEHARGQILTRTALWDVNKAAGTGTAFTLNNIISYRSGSSYVTIAFDLTIGDKTDQFGVFAFYNAELNTDMANLGNNLIFRTKDITGASFSVTIDSFTADSDGTGITVNYSVQNGSPNYDIDLNLDGSTNPQATATHSSDGSYSLKDSDADTSTQQDYTVVATDSAGNQVSDSRTFKTLFQ